MENNNIGNDIGKRILYIREKEGMSQEEFARKLGLTKSAISGYETGRRTPPNAILKSIAQTFSYSENWLFYGTGDSKLLKMDEGLCEIFSYFKCTEFETDFLRKYFNMSRKERDLFCHYMNYLFGDASLEKSTASDIILDVMQKEPKDRTNEETEALKAEFCKQIDEEKEAAVKSSVSSEFGGFNAKMA